MKRIACILIALTHVATAGHPALPVLLALATAEDGPTDPGTPEVGWWKFESGAFTTDSSGNGRTLDNVGCTNPNTTRGYVARCAATSQYMRRNSFDLDSYTQWTVAFWMAPLADTSQPNSFPRPWAAGDFANGGVFTSLFNATPERFGLYLGTGSGQTQVVNVTNQGDFLGGGWRHMLLQRDGTSYAVYVDGVEAGTGTGTYTAASRNRMAVFRDSSFLGSTAMLGDMDDLRIYSRILTEAEKAWLADPSLN